jgi:hypothetical protein
MPSYIFLSAVYPVVLGAMCRSQEAKRRIPPFSETSSVALVIKENMKSLDQKTVCDKVTLVLHNLLC